MTRWRKAVLFCVVASAASGIATPLAVWQLLSPVERPPPQVPFADFVARAHAGEVREVFVNGSVYVYTFATVPDGGDYCHLDDGGVVCAPVGREQTTGPTPDITEVRALRPEGHDLNAPKFFFEK